MSTKRIAAAAAIVLCASSCGGRTLADELGMVPSSVLLHLHLERPLPQQAWSFLPEGRLPVDSRLIQDLSARGPLGMSIVSLDLTSLEPQLMLLSASVSPESMIAISGSYLEFVPDSADRRTDLVSPRGDILGSVASRDGYTLLYIGGAPTSLVPLWLEMESAASLAGDSSLALISDANGADLSIFVPSSLVQLLRFAPGGAWVSWWGDLEQAMSMVQPAAARVDMSFSGFVTVEARLVRDAGRVSRLRVEFEDSGITPGELLSLILVASGMGGL